MSKVDQSSRATSLTSRLNMTLRQSMGSKMTSRLSPLGMKADTLKMQAFTKIASPKLLRNRQ